MLRPVAFRTLTKKHNLTLTSSGLGLLSSFVGKFCGSGWREEGLAERALDEIAKAWRRQGGGAIIEDGPDKQLSAILKSLEPCMSAGRVDVGKLSRTNSAIGTLSRQSSLLSRPEANRQDSQSSLGMSALDVDNDMELDQDGNQYRDARPFLKVISAFKQPQFTYSSTKKSVERISSEPTLLPPIQQKVALFRNRYNMIHQRLLRNEAFQTSSVSSARPPSLQRSGSTAATMSNTYKITPISNLLGRSGTTFLLLGLLATAAAGDLALTDLSGSVVLEISNAQQIPLDSAWICPGMIVLLEGIYTEDGSNTGNLGGAGGVGGQIKGRFLVHSIANPPPERREVTMAVGHDIKNQQSNTVGAGFGWVDFLGVGSEKAVGPQMRKLQQRIMGKTDDQEPVRSKVVIIGDCNLDSPRILEAIRAILASYTNTGDDADRPLSVVLMGNFVSAASMAGSAKGGGSVEYKEHFDALASILSEFPKLLSSTTFVFVPGDNDPWASSFSSGAATVLPRGGIPELFTSRIRRAIATVNNELGGKRSETPGEAVWASNPARLCLFGPLMEIVLFRDDVSGRFRRNSVTLGGNAEADDDESVNGKDGQEQVQEYHQSQDETADTDAMDTDLPTIIDATNPPPPANQTRTTITTTSTSTKPATSTNPVSLSEARKLTTSLLTQSTLSPFPLSLRPTLWSYASSLNLYPLPSAVILCDRDAPAFGVVYEGCFFGNTGKVVDDIYLRKGGGGLGGGFGGSGAGSGAGTGGARGGGGTAGFGSLGGGGRGSGEAKWLEFDVVRKRGVVRDVRF